MPNDPQAADAFFTDSGGRREWRYATLVKALLPGLVTIVGVVAVWHVLSRTGLVDPLFLPSPMSTLDALVSSSRDGSLLANTLASLNRVVMGFLLAVFVGVPVGLLLGWSRRVGVFLTPIVELIRPIPPIAWIPLAILWFGIGNSSAYFVVFLAAFFPIFTNAQVAARVIEPIHVNAARCLGASRRMIVTDVIIPSALPVVLGGVRTGLGISWMAVVAAELVAAQSGLGYWISLSRLQLQSENVVGGMVAIGIVGVAMSAGMGWLERRLTPWRRGVVSR